MAFPTVASQTGGLNAAGTSHTVNLPAGISSGNLLIVHLASGGATPTWAVTWPAGWTEITGANNSNTPGVQLNIAYRVADGTEGSSITVNTVKSVYSAYTSDRITGFSGTPEAGTAVGSATSTPDPPSLSPSWGAADTLWIAVNGHAGNSTATTTAYPTNYTGGREDGVTPPATGALLASAARQLNAVSEDPGMFTMDSADAWIAQTVAVKPVAASASGSRLSTIGCGG